MCVHYYKSCVLLISTLLTPSIYIVSCKHPKGYLAITYSFNAYEKWETENLCGL
jgi:hypothetical protein